MYLNEYYNKTTNVSTINLVIFSVYNKSKIKNRINIEI